MRQSKPSSRYQFTIRNERRVFKSSASVMVSTVKFARDEIKTSLYVLYDR